MTNWTGISGDAPQNLERANVGAVQHNLEKLVDRHGFPTLLHCLGDSIHQMRERSHLETALDAEWEKLEQIIDSARTQAEKVENTILAGCRWPSIPNELPQPKFWFGQKVYNSHERMPDDTDERGRAGCISDR